MNNTHLPKILAIDTSCDDTSVGNHEIYIRNNTYLQKNLRQKKFVGRYFRWKSWNLNYE
ncbi:MAG: hypothetical protein KBC30_09580 [Planctomycetes bacterium]|nr:hypothetical protein [Planctomycetota bacterium]HNZ66717.1 hypothetical protein [Planctomycetota bacterium]HPY74653.1 hypothetical protein [Planctomycetota bacterium]HQB00351.1 hypothetical protein [Planctomycetota bacterium]